MTPNLFWLQGVDGAKLELQEVVDFLKNPDKYTALGAKIPKARPLPGLLNGLFCHHVRGISCLTLKQRHCYRCYLPAAG